MGNSLDEATLISNQKKDKKYSGNLKAVSSRCQELMRLYNEKTRTDEEKINEETVLSGSFSWKKTTSTIHIYLI